MKEEVTKKEKHSKFRELLGQMFGVTPDIEDDSEYEKWEKDPNVEKVLKRSEKNRKNLESLFVYPDKKIEPNKSIKSQNIRNVTKKQSRVSSKDLREKNDDERDER